MHLSTSTDVWRFAIQHDSMAIWLNAFEYPGMCSNIPGHMLYRVPKDGQEELLHKNCSIERLTACFGEVATVGDTM